MEKDAHHQVFRYSEEWESFKESRRRKWVIGEGIKEKEKLEWTCFEKKQFDDGHDGRNGRGGNLIKRKEEEQKW